jgi:hypothetical protein
MTSCYHFSEKHMPQIRTQFHINALIHLNLLWTMNVSQFVQTNSGTVSPIFHTLFFQRYLTQYSQLSYTVMLYNLRRWQSIACERNSINLRTWLVCYPIHSIMELRDTVYLISSALCTQQPITLHNGDVIQKENRSILNLYRPYLVFIFL